MTEITWSRVNAAEHRQGSHITGMWRNPSCHGREETGEGRHGKSAYGVIHTVTGNRNRDNVHYVTKDTRSILDCIALKNV